MAVVGERIRYSEVELTDTTPEAFRSFIAKWKVFERECRVWWDRSWIHKGVIGFLDLRWRYFIELRYRYPSHNKIEWMEAEPDLFEEFILWVADVVERETNTGGTSVERASQALRDNAIHIDAMTGGIRIELMWSKLNPFFSLLDIRNFSRDDYEEIKQQIFNSLIPKDGRI